MKKILLERIKTNQFIRLLFYPMRIIRHWEVVKRSQERISFLEEISIRVIDGYAKIEVPDYKGVFNIDLRSNLLHRMLLYNDYESQVARLITENIDSNRDAIDIGANIGLHTVLLSKLLNRGRRVLAFEPTPNALKYLKRNIDENSCEEGVIVFEGIASNKKGEYVLDTIEGKEEYSALNKITHPDAKQYNTLKIKVNGNTIDNLVDYYHLSPGFIKVDAEGSEGFVFEGAKETIKKYKPVIISEISDIMLSNNNHESLNLLNFLMDNGYKIFDVIDLQEIKKAFDGYFIALPN